MSRSPRVSDTMACDMFTMWGGAISSPLAPFCRGYLDVHFNENHFCWHVFKDSFSVCRGKRASETFPRKPDARRAPRYLRSPAPRRSPTASVPRPPFRACSTHCDVSFSFSSLRFYRDNNTYDELCSPGSKSPARRCADHICRDRISHRSPSHRSWGAGISGGRDSAHGLFPWVLCRL